MNPDKEEIFIINTIFGIQKNTLFISFKSNKLNIFSIKIIEMDPTLHVLEERKLLRSKKLDFQDFGCMYIIIDVYFTFNNSMDLQLLVAGLVQYCVVTLAK